ncbi:MAG: phosphate acetyltransferase [Anaerovoracaceae bacterium]|jgi:phosphate acetyltransferase
MAVINTIKDRARADLKRIVLPETDDERILRAADMTLKEGTAKLILIGDEKDIKNRAGALGLDLSGASFINPVESPKLDEYSNVFYELRKKKGITPEQAKEKISTDYVYFGVVMVREGDADGLVSGAAHTSADTLRPALQIVKTAKTEKMVSSFFLIEVPDCEYGENGTFMFADCGLTQDPTSEELADIADMTARSFKDLVQAEPRIAFISHSTKGSAKHDLVDKVTNALKIAHETYPELKCDGEFQVDAAIVPEVAAFKAPGSELAGTANVLIFPNIDAGNSAYKIAERLAKASAYGPVLQGIAKPINDLSRGCRWQDIPGVIAITAVQAQLTEKRSK